MNIGYRNQRNPSKGNGKCKFLGILYVLDRSYLEGHSRDQEQKRDLGDWVHLEIVQIIGRRHVHQGMRCGKIAKIAQKAAVIFHLYTIEIEAEPPEIYCKNCDKVNFTSFLSFKSRYFIENFKFFLQISRFSSFLFQPCKVLQSA